MSGYHYRGEKARLLGRLDGEMCARLRPDTYDPEKGFACRQRDLTEDDRDEYFRCYEAAYDVIVERALQATLSRL